MSRTTISMAFTFASRRGSTKINCTPIKFPCTQRASRGIVSAEILKSRWHPCGSPEESVRPCRDSIQSLTFSLPFPQRNKRKEGIVVTTSQFPGSRGSLFASGSFQRDDALAIKNGLRAGREIHAEDGTVVDGS